MQLMVPPMNDSMPPEIPRAIVSVPPPAESPMTPVMGREGQSAPKANCGSIRVAPDAMTYSMNFLLVISGIFDSFP